MEEILILSNNKEQNTQLARFVKGLFPNCKVIVTSNKDGNLHKFVKCGVQYAEVAKSN
jgi:hypothetical protein